MYYVHFYKVTIFAISHVLWAGVHATANQIKRWVFMTECSVHESHSKRPSNVLLVIRFWAQTAGHDLYLPISHNLVVSMVS